MVKKSMEGLKSCTLTVVDRILLAMRFINVSRRREAGVVGAVGSLIGSKTKTDSVVPFSVAMDFSGKEESSVVGGGKEWGLLVHKPMVWVGRKVGRKE